MLQRTPNTGLSLRLDPTLGPWNWEFVLGRHPVQGCVFYNSLEPSPPACSALHCCKLPLLPWLWLCKMLSRQWPYGHASPSLHDGERMFQQIFLMNWKLKCNAINFQISTLLERNRHIHRKYYNELGSTGKIRLLK